MVPRDGRELQSKNCAVPRKRSLQDIVAESLKTARALEVVRQRLTRYRNGI